MCGEKAAPLCPALRPTRITPACAGKSHGHQPFVQAVKDHPRVCGEKHEPARAQGLIMGSPPRVRGKVSAVPVLLPCVGITPACAGKSNARWQFRTSHRDHPRVCGEKFMLPWLNALELGSPPRVRGKVQMALVALGRNKDHPRVCGEKFVELLQNGHHKGSPPRVRGKVAE